MITCREQVVQSRVGKTESERKNNFVELLGPSRHGQTLPARLLTTLYFLVYFYSIVERADKIVRRPHPHPPSSRSSRSSRSLLLSRA